MLQFYTHKILVLYTGVRYLSKKKKRISCFKKVWKALYLCNQCPFLWWGNWEPKGAMYLLEVVAVRNSLLRSNENSQIRSILGMCHFSQEIWYFLYLIPTLRILHFVLKPKEKQNAKGGIPENRWQQANPGLNPFHANMWLWFYIKSCFLSMKLLGVRQDDRRKWSILFIVDVFHNSLVFSIMPHGPDICRGYGKVNQCLLGGNVGQRG